MEIILDEVRRDVFENPKPTIDLDYLYSVKKEIQRYAADTNSQLKKNVYQNYSLFIQSSQEIAALKEEMRQLNGLLEHQQTAMNKLLDQLNKSPIIQSTIERTETRNDIFGTDGDANDEILPQWFVKSPEDFDILIAHRNLREAVELEKKIRLHFMEYPNCCDHTDLKETIESRIQELIHVIISEMQPRRSKNSILLLRELNLTSRAVKLYLDMRSSVMHRQKPESSTKRMCSVFFDYTIETCNEFKQAFGLEGETDSCGRATYASLAYWITLEFENFIRSFREHLFNNPTPLSLSIIAEGIHYLKNQCSRMKAHFEMDITHFVERELSNDIRHVIEESGRKLIEATKKLDSDENWQPQRFESKAEKTRFLEDMNDVDLKTMSKYITEYFELNFTASKTAFARCFLITVNDLAKLATPSTKNHVDTVLAKAFEMQIQSVIDALSQSKVTSKARFIKGNSNFLLDKVIVVATEKYTSITGEKCQKLLDLRTKFSAKADSVAKLQNV